MSEYSEHQTRCLCCGSTRFEPMIFLGDVPVLANALAADSISAQCAPTGDIDLVCCETCGLVCNRAFDPARMAYAATYENALHHSPRFQAFAETLAADLVSLYGLERKTIAEIGCGDGFMLSLMQRHGVGRSVGFDPSMDGRLPFNLAPGASIVPEYFDPEQLTGDVSAVLCRHVLEHLDDPLAMLQGLRNQIGERETIVYFEVPNAQWMLEAVSIWDVIYEHVTYWTAPAIQTLFRRAGFAPHVIGTGFGDQFLMVHAKPVEPEPDFVAADVHVARKASRFFTDRADALVAEWRDKMTAFDGRAVLWGAGSKGICFVNSVLPRETSVAAIVDLNPLKHGKHLPGAGVPVVPPKAIADVSPDLVLIANGIYEQEVRAEVSKMGLSPEFCVITA